MAMKVTKTPIKNSTSERWQKNPVSTGAVAKRAANSAVAKAATKAAAKTVTKATAKATAKAITPKMTKTVRPITETKAKSKKPY